MMICDRCGGREEVHSVSFIGVAMNLIGIGLMDLCEPCLSKLNTIISEFIEKGDKDDEENILG